MPVCISLLCAHQHTDMCSFFLHPLSPPLFHSKKNASSWDQQTDADLAIMNKQFETRLRLEIEPETTSKKRGADNMSEDEEGGASKDKGKGKKPAHMQGRGGGSSSGGGGGGGGSSSDAWELHPAFLEEFKEVKAGLAVENEKGEKLQTDLNEAKREREELQRKFDEEKGKREESEKKVGVLTALLDGVTRDKMVEITETPAKVQVLEARETITEAQVDAKLETAKEGVLKTVRDERKIVVEKTEKSCKDFAKEQVVGLVTREFVVE